VGSRAGERRIVSLAVALGFLEFLKLLAAPGLPPFAVAGMLFTAGAFAQVAFVDWPACRSCPPECWSARCGAHAQGAFAESVPALPRRSWRLVRGRLGGTIAALRIQVPETQGPARILLLMAIVMAADTLAFFAGSAFDGTSWPLRSRRGRASRAPWRAPGRRPGRVGRPGHAPAIPRSHAVVLGLAVTGAAIAGDLFESC
jgi:CDP-diglyceride synthetase